VIFLSGDDAEAKSEVTALFEDAGFVAIDLGGLVTGGAMQQLGGPLAGVNLVQLPGATVHTLIDPRFEGRGLASRAGIPLAGQLGAKDPPRRAAD